MRAFVITAPGEAGVQQVDAPIAVPGDVVVDVERAGVCGTDVEFYTGEMAYLHQRHAHFPMRIGHEWMGTVASVGAGVDARWVGRRVAGDTMLGCGACRRCLGGHQHVCASRQEVGIRGGRAGALAEQIAVPASSLHRLPDDMDAALGALVEPAGNALRSVQAAHLQPGDRVLILGPGTIGLLCAMFARAASAEVHLLARSQRSADFARTLGFEQVWSNETIPALPFDAVIDASNSAAMPQRAVDLVEPAGHVVLVGLSGTPSTIDTRDLALNDVTAVGILSASPGLADAIEAFAEGIVDPRPLVAATISLDELSAVLAGRRPEGAGHGPKIHIDPRITLGGTA